MNNLNKLKKLNTKNHTKKIIMIPTDKELYNLITNIYILKCVLSFEYYIKNDFLDYATKYTKNITKYLKDKIKNNNYDFNFYELLKYIDTSIHNDYFFSDIITDLENLQEPTDLLKNPYNFFLEHNEYDGDIDLKININTFMKKLKDYVNSKSFIALNKPIGYIK